MMMNKMCIVVITNYFVIQLSVVVVEYYIAIVIAN